MVLGETDWDESALTEIAKGEKGQRKNCVETGNDWKQLEAAVEGRNDSRMFL